MQSNTLAVRNAVADLRRSLWIFSKASRIIFPASFDARSANENLAGIAIRPSIYRREGYIKCKLANVVNAAKHCRFMLL